MARQIKAAPIFNNAGPKLLGGGWPSTAWNACVATRLSAARQCCMQTKVHAPCMAVGFATCIAVECMVPGAASAADKNWWRRAADLIEIPVSLNELFPFPEFKERPPKKTPSCKEIRQQLQQPRRRLDAPRSKVRALAAASAAVATGDACGGAVRRRTILRSAVCCRLNAVAACVRCCVPVATGAVRAEAHSTEEDDHHAAGEIQIAPLPRVAAQHVAARGT
jgi:hypothetical protein